MRQFLGSVFGRQELLFGLKLLNCSLTSWNYGPVSVRQFLGAPLGGEKRGILGVLHELGLVHVAGSQNPEQNITGRCLKMFRFSEAIPYTFCENFV